MQQRGYTGDGRVMNFYETLQLKHIQVTLYPAGHILGSAMIFVESDEGSLLYTGDCKTPPSPVSEGFNLPANINYLIIEGTFGLPIYRWKPLKEISRDIRAFALNVLREKCTPVFLAYNLGKAQELMHILAPLQQTVQIHKDGYKLCTIYEEEGVCLGNYEKIDLHSSEGKILITPSSTDLQQITPDISRLKVAYCSGWAVHNNNQRGDKSQKKFPLSDHLDFFELIRICKQISPKKVTITHSPNPDVLLHYLGNLGIDSEAV
jgi:putative mRNA 3-end processing factor